MALNLDTIGKKIGPITKDYTWKDVVLYALGVGAGFEDLEYCYEDRLKVIPSFSIGSSFDFLAAVGMDSGANLAGILHGEQDIIFHDTIPVEGSLTSEGTITHIYDKGEGKGALVVAEADTFHDNGEKLFTNVFTLFCRLDGGFDGEKAPAEDFQFPDRDPDFVEKAGPEADAPLLYRLSGDVFQLHVDPDFAKASGFEKPIMHGLCTHGYSCRAVIKHLFPGAPERIRRFRTRFSKPLYPGVPIETRIWKIEEGLAFFQTVNAETGEVVIDRGIVEWLTPDELALREKRKGIRYDDRVAIVTGAGAGLGRVYALDLAKRGAKVVVNDLGGARDGSGDGSAKVADEVVKEIQALGGEAVSSYDSVATPEGGQAIVDKAMEAFGRVDILVNNAGILRDGTFVKMEPASWDQVRSVHLDGAYNVTRPAFLKMKEAGYGRVVMTTSAAGLFGNFGQANYSAAKMGLVGLMNTLNIEGGKYDIKVNAVAPLAGTRLTEDVLPEDLFERTKSEYVAPIVLFLCSEKCPDSGSIYTAGMGHFARAAMVQGPGAVAAEEGVLPSAEAVAKNIKKIASLEGAEEFGNAMESLNPAMEAFKPKKKPPKDTGGGGGGLTVATVFGKMPEVFNADKAAGVDVVFQYKIDGPGGGEWYVTIKDGTCEVAEGAHSSPTTTIIMGEEDFIGLMEGKVNAMKAYTTGKLKIEGDLMKSQLIEKLFTF